MFNVENAIQSWKRNLRSNPAFEDGDIEELESHLREEISRLRGKGYSGEEAFSKAVETMGKTENLGQEMYKTRTTSVDATPPWEQKSGILSLLPNYLKVCRRNLIRNKLFAGINIIGLSIGITCCLLIYLFVSNELKYDEFHSNGERIYKVIRIMDSERDARKVGITSAPFRDAILNDMPDLVEEATRLMPSDGLVRIGDSIFMEDRFYITDANFFRIFSWPLIQGDDQSVLNRPNTVVISEKTAKKYFGNEDPIGKTIEVDGDTDFEVTGVFRKPEYANSHVDFDLLASMETFKEANFFEGWWWNTLHTYVMLPPKVKPDQLEARFPGFMEKYFGDNMIQNNRRIDLDLVPLEEVYFANDITFDWQIKHGNRAIINMFVIIAILIIAVACVNFINMATARSVKRAREIGIRKTLGARRLNLAVQFLGEALLITFVAGLISIIAVYSMMPVFQQIIGKEITVSLLSSDVLFTCFLLLLVTGILAGSYPAILLSSFQPVKALKEKISFGPSQVIIRKGLIIFQFVISSILIIGTLVVNKQLHFVSNKSLGFQPDQLLNISINNDDIRTHLETFLQEIERLPGVRESSVMSGTPGGYFDNHRFRVGENRDQTHVLKVLFTDFNFTEVLDLEMLAGRGFSPSYPTDSTRAVVINKEAADKFGWSLQDALGKQFENQFVDSTAREVIGVVENFHIESLHHTVAPLVVSMTPDRREILVKIEPGNAEQTLNSVTELWQEFSPLFPIEYFFLDQQFAQLYKDDKRQRAVFSSFSLVAIFLACMGLFSLAAFNAENRTKEMGIRKVLGASISDILLLFNSEVISVVLISFLMAIPVAWFLVEQWLQDYAYRIQNGIENYLIAGIIIGILSILTVSYQSFKLAKMNPVKNIRSD